ncbi:MAG: FtsX-like permease family protein [Cyclobacteriaceae bacterium]|nr:FtsX-like permease family protein [Cyclobacteriaceae bacterium]
MNPPRWADRFLQWYCHPDLLEQIQGDVYELFYRSAKKNKTWAKISFIWNVVRFFRLKNIRPVKNNYQNNLFGAMIKNMLLISVRNFVRQPGHSLLNVFGLATGFTCAFLILLWVSQEYSFDRFHPETEKLFKVITHVNGSGTIQTYDAASAGISVSTVPEIESAAIVSNGSRWPHELCFRAEGKANECVYKNGVYANESLFSIFNFPILEGDPNPLKGNTNIAISEDMAIALFGEASPVGKMIKIDDFWEVTIASVFKNIPSNSSLRFDFAMPFSILKKQWGVNDDQLSENFFPVYVKTHKAVSAELLTEKLNTAGVLTEELREQKIAYQAYPLTDWRLNSKFEEGKNSGGRIEYVVLFIVIASLVVIMAVINFVNMSTARATLRAKEIGVRKVTGAMRSAIAAQFMGESFMIVLVAFLLSGLITQLVLPFFNALLSEPIQISLLTGYIPLYLFLFLISVALIAGVYPAMVMSSFQPARILKNQFGNTTGSHRLRSVLLVVQLSVSIGIIIFTGVLYKQIGFISEKNLGFDRSNTIRVEPTIRVLRKMGSFKDELSKDPSIVGIGASQSNPLTLGGGNTGVSWPGKPDGTRISFKTMGCSYDFPEVIGLKIIEGRNFEEKTSDSLRSEVLITEESAKIMNLANPIGQEISVGNAKSVIIGIVNDFHTGSLHESREPVILFRVTYDYISAVYIKYQPGQAKRAFEVIQKAYNNVEPTFTMRYWFQDDTFHELYQTEMIASRLVLLFTIVVLIIAIIGMVGLTTFNIMRRNKEISIRRVFGASIRQVLVLLFNQFTGVLIIALLIAGPVAWLAANRWLEGFAYHTSMPWEFFALTFVGVAALIALIIWIQSLKTISANPTQTLRSE